MKWNLTTIPLKNLKDNPKNPRKILKPQLDRLAKLIDKFGLIDKPIVNADMTLIGGHQRIRILKKQKLKQVECWVADHQLTDEEIDELCIGLNLHQGSWDYDILANMYDLDALVELGFNEDQLLECGKAVGEIDTPEESLEKKMKIQKCPQCGHEFA